MSQMVRVALGQMCSSTDADENLAAIDALAASAKLSDAHYLQVPEMAVMFAESAGQLARNTSGFEGNPHLEKARFIAKAHQLHLHLGSMAIALPDGRFANRSVLIDPQGQISATYDKIHLFDADVPGAAPYRESATYMGGDQLVAPDISVAGQVVTLGLSICFDVRFAEHYAALAAMGAQILCVPAAFTQPTGEAHWDVLLRARAIETGAFVIAAAQAGQHANGRATHGHSVIIDPWGRVVAQQADRDTGLVVADLDMDVVKDARARLPVANIREKLRLSRAT